MNLLTENWMDLNLLQNLQRFGSQLQQGNWFETNLLPALTSLWASLSPGDFGLLAMAVLVGLFAPSGYKRIGFFGLVGIVFLTPVQLFLLILFSLSLIFAKLGIIRVPEGNVAIVERFGRFHQRLEPGLNFIVPGFDHLKKDLGLRTYIEDPQTRRHHWAPIHSEKGMISMKENLLDPESQNMIANDNAVVIVDSVVYFQIIDAESAVYKVKDLGLALLKLIDTTLRQEVGKLNSDEVIVSREAIGTRVQESLELAAEPWGTRVVRVEIQSIEFESGIQEKLAKAREAELAGRADVVEKERERDARVAEAEGHKRATVLMAEGDFERERLEAEARFLKASREKEGEAQGLAAINEALRENSEGVIAIEALRAQRDVARHIGESDNTLIMPSESLGLVGAIGALGRAVPKLLAPNKKTDSAETE